MWKGSSLALLCLPLIAAGSDLQRFERVEPHMGTLFRITLYAPDVERAREAFDAAFARVHELDEKLSDYKPKSELMSLSTQPQRVSEDLFRVLEASQKLARESDGAFDVTLGPVTRLWRKGITSTSAIGEAMQKTGYTNLILDASTRSAHFARPGMQLDLGGIAKGYAADQALKVLRNRGLSEAVIAASGDLTIGSREMTIAAEPVKGFRRQLVLSNAAISTSGDTEQFFEAGGNRYSHILDPKTGLGLTNGIGVTVIADTGMRADSLATAICAMGAQRGSEFVRGLDGVSALIVSDGRALAATGQFVTK